MIALIIYCVLATVAIIVLAVYFSRCLDDLKDQHAEFANEHDLRLLAESQYHTVSDKYNDLASTHAKTLNTVMLLENDKKELEKELNKFPFRDEKGRYCKRTV